MEEEIVVMSSHDIRDYLSLLTFQTIYKISIIILAVMCLLTAC